VTQNVKGPYLPIKTLNRGHVNICIAIDQVGISSLQESPVVWVNTLSLNGHYEVVPASPTVNTEVREFIHQTLWRRI
jgi:hypothetical protein